MSSKGVALVTGAGQGIGRAIALKLADDGFDVAVNDIQEEKLVTVVQEIKAKGRKASAHFADVAVEDQVKKMVDEVVKEHGSLDVMVANAGIAIHKPILDTAECEWDRVFSVNAKGTFFCYKHAGKQMIAQGRGGRIIGAASTSAKRGSANLAVYCGTKFAIRGITQAAAAEFGPYGITVNTYAPGPIQTSLLEKLDDAEVTRNGGEKGSFLEDLRNRTLVKFNGTTDDVASLVSYLASKESRFITGQSISCNGGMFFD